MQVAQSLVFASQAKTINIKLLALYAAPLEPLLLLARRAAAGRCWIAPDGVSRDGGARAGQRTGRGHGLAHNTHLRARPRAGPPGALAEDAPPPAPGGRRGAVGRHCAKREPLGWAVRRPSARRARSLAKHGSAAAMDLCLVAEWRRRSLLQQFTRGGRCPAGRKATTTRGRMPPSRRRTTGQRRPPGPPRRQCPRSAQAPARRRLSPVPHTARRGLLPPPRVWRQAAKRGVRGARAA